MTRTVLLAMRDLELRVTEIERRLAWIATADRLPAKDGPVLAWSKRRGSAETYYFDTRSGQPRWRESTGVEVYPPSHWMPLPMVPDEGDDR